MTTIYSTYFVCRQCGIKIPAYFIGSTSMNMGKIHTDYYCENLGSQIIHYQLSICPECLFVGYDSDFDAFLGDSNKHPPFEELQKLEQRYPPTQRYIMLAERLIKEQASLYEIADCYLKASQSERMLFSKDVSLNENRPAASKELESICQKKAVQYFLLSIGPNETGQKGLLYLIGELLRRAGDFLQSEDYFNKAKTAALNEETFGVYLNDAGDHPEVVAKQLRILTSMRKSKSLDLVRTLPAKLFSFKDHEDAVKLADLFKGAGAKVTIKKEDEISPNGKNFIELIQRMKGFAQNRDASDKFMWEEQPSS